MKIAVIGSGPSGWSAIQKSRSLGHETWVIDSALTEDDKYLTQLKKPASHLSKKLYFGSDLPYRHFEFGPKIQRTNVNPIYSFAKGGLSLVWGATMLPVSPQDIIHWPLKKTDLHKYYLEIADLIPISGSSDRLDEVYGTYLSRSSVFFSNRMLKILENSFNVNTNEFCVGGARLALETGNSVNRGCFYCNKCLDGCSDNFIWSSKLESTSENFVKMRVMNLHESKNGVLVNGIDENGDQQNTLEFDKVFLAAGAVESFRISAESGLVPNRAIMKDSATYFIPFKASKKLGSYRSNSFALSQCFMRFKALDSSSFTQIQLYEYSDDLIKRVKSALPITAFLPNWVLRKVLSHFVIGIGYLGDQDSPSMLMERDDKGDVTITMNSSGKSLYERNSKVKQLIAGSKNIFNKVGLSPFVSLVRYANPGEGSHFGGWLPMGTLSDNLGRPNGSKNVHIVDASILPSIPPGPITFTLMANSRRIVEESLR